MKLNRKDKNTYLSISVLWPHLLDGFEWETERRVFVGGGSGGAGVEKRREKRLCAS